MSGITVNIKSLQELQTAIKDSSRHLDNVYGEEKDYISNQEKCFEAKLNELQNILSQAEYKLNEAMIILRTAEANSVSVDNEGNTYRVPVPTEYYEAVRVCQQEVEIAQYKYRKAQEIRERFARYVSEHINQQDSLYGTYFSIVNQGNTVLTEYCGQLIKSNEALTGDVFVRSVTNDNKEENTVSHTSSSSPRSLSQTQQEWHDEPDGSKIFNSPVETGVTLDAKQGKYTDEGGRYKGTCGLCSCENVLRLSGVIITEEEVVKYASTNDLCTAIGSTYDKGATNARERQQILSHFGIESQCISQFSDGKPDLELISDYVTEGRGVIVSVNANKLYGVISLRTQLHAVTVTSVKKDMQGNIVGFYLCDSNDSPSAYYSAKAFSRALTDRSMNVTDTIIR